VLEYKLLKILFHSSYCHRLNHICIFRTNRKTNSLTEENTSGINLSFLPIQVVFELLTSCPSLSQLHSVTLPPFRDVTDFIKYVDFKSFLSEQKYFHRYSSPLFKDVTYIQLNLNSVNHLIVVMVKCGVLFEVRTEFLNNI
jgi:hypothetical protein